MLGLTPRNPQRIQSNPQERALITAAQRGDVRAFNQLVYNYQELAYRLAYHMLGDGDAAADVTQTAFVRAFCDLKHLSGESFKLWLLRLVTHSCNEQPQKISSSLAFRPNPLALMQKGLATLSPEERVVCVLADIEGLDYSDIAQITDLSVATVKARIRRARFQVRDFLLANSTAPEPLHDGEANIQGIYRGGNS